MTLKEIRLLLRGTPYNRTDLASAAGADLGGCDALIRAAQTELEKIQPSPAALSEFRFTVDPTADPDNWWIPVPTAVAIHKVWLVDSTGSHSELDYLTLPDMMTEYPMMEETDVTTPVHWTKSVSRVGSSATLGPSENESSSFVHNIVIMPPSDTEYTLKAHGAFKALTLTVDGDISWWSNFQPYTLAQMAMYLLHIGYGSERKAALNLNAVVRTLDGIAKDIVEDGLARGSRIEG